MFLNWSATALVSSGAMKTQASIMGATVNGNNKSIGALVMPGFSPKKGCLWRVEEQVTRMMVNAALNMDNVFVLPYKERTDEREKRPVCESFSKHASIRTSGMSVERDSGLLHEQPTDMFMLVFLSSFLCQSDQ